MAEKNFESSKTQWHTLLGTLLEMLLTPVGIDVSTNVAVMSSPPEADILLLRRHRRQWSAEQMSRLPDGIRDSAASHILMEFKYTESLNDRAIRQAIGYDYFYQEAHELKRHELQTLVASAKTPRDETLQRFGYGKTAWPGVYRSHVPVLEEVLLLVLNELADTPHNAPIKCFARRKPVKQNAFMLLYQGILPVASTKFWWFLEGLWNYWFLQEENIMTQERALTPEQVTEMGKLFSRHILQYLPPEERLAGLKPEERLAGLKPEERLAGLSPEMGKRLSKHFLQSLPPEERLAGLSIEEIERYVRQLKAQAASTSETPEDK